MTYKIAMLTDIDNGYPQEDTMLAEYLGRSIDVQIVNLHQLEAVEDHVDGVFVRNIWPDLRAENVLDYRARKQTAYKRLEFKNIRVYNPRECRADMKGKGHLLQLYRAGYPVIPTIDNAEDINDLPASAAFLMKHIYDLCGLNQMSGDATYIEEKWEEGYVIQPRLDFMEEVQFFFVDNHFITANKTPRRDIGSDIQFFTPDPDDIAVAQRFVDWNNVKHSFQRVDFCRMPDGQLLLMELEDEAPYLWLRKMSPDLQDTFMSAIEASLLKWLEH